MLAYLLHSLRVEVASALFPIKIQELSHVPLSQYRGLRPMNLLLPISQRILDGHFPTPLLNLECHPQAIPVTTQLMPHSNARIVPAPTTLNTMIRFLTSAKCPSSRTATCGERLTPVEEYKGPGGFDRFTET